jgi:hypothetical protein
MDSGTLKELAIKVSQYFLDFLESDFKRQQAPRRRVILQTESGFKSGMRVSPYPNLQRDLWRLLENIAPDATLKMMPRSYQRPITATLTDSMSWRRMVTDRSIRGICSWCASVLTVWDGARFLYRYPEDTQQR